MCSKWTNLTITYGSQNGNIGLQQASGRIPAEDIEFKMESTTRHHYWSRWFALEIWYKSRLRESECLSRKSWAISSDGLRFWYFYQIFTFPKPNIMARNQSNSVNPAVYKMLCPLKWYSIPYNNQFAFYTWTISKGFRSIRRSRSWQGIWSSESCS